MRRESGPLRPAPEPLRVDTARIVLVGTALWFAAFVVLLFGVSALAADGRLVWLWTCLAGWVLGVIGLGIIRWQNR